MNNKTILITGNWIIRKKFAENVLKNLNQKTDNLFEDELKQFEMSNNPIFKNSKILRFFIGDVRDFDRQKLHLKMSIMLYAAALKQVPTAEYNPTECIKPTYMVLKM